MEQRKSTVEGLGVIMKHEEIFQNKSEAEARQQILDQVRAYYEKYHVKKPYEQGDRIS